MYHFYFRGKYNGSAVELPPLDQIHKSGYRFNITDVYDDIRFISNGNAGALPMIVNIVVSFLIVINLM